jgi:membrane-associated protease RseP (regulator of RpoE activity)
MPVLPWRMLVRDALLLLLTGLVWRADAALRGEPGALPALVGVAAGALAAIAVYLAHEWGHLLAARAAGSRVHYPERVTSTFLFFFDVGANDRRQFLAMSLGGFAASAIALPLLFESVPAGALSSWVAMGLAAAGLVATIATELPPFLRVLRGAPLPRGFVYRDGARQGV